MRIFPRACTLKTKRNDLLMMSSPLILCRTVLLLLASLCLASTSSAATIVPHDATIIIVGGNNSAPTASTSLTSASAATAPTAVVIAAALEQHDALAPSALNPPSPPRRLLIPSADQKTAGGPPLFVGSDGAQRFFDRLHGFIDGDKPVAVVVKQHHRRSDNTPESGHSSSQSTTTKGIVEARSSAHGSHADDDDDDAIVDAVHDAQPSAAAAVDVVDAFAANRQNWILQEAKRTRHDADDQKTVEANGVVDARQMYASLSERIIGQLAAGNPWVNWTQSTGPVVVHSIANVPIGQFPFVFVQPTQTPAKDQQPPRRGWLSFQRPFRIYGEGTESKFPPVLERVVQRIQNYFSVFKYQDTSRPLPGQPGTTTLTDAVEDGAPLVVQDEIIAPAVANTIEIDIDMGTVSDFEETTASDGTTTTVTASDLATTTEPQRIEELLETTTNVEPSELERLNEIAEPSDKDSRRNDKIIKIDQFNKV